jgi:type IV pilus assembly protein PilW
MMRSRRPRQSGLSMIELMVALTLSMVMLGGVLALFISSKKGYAVQEASGRLQENGRFAVVNLETALRQADYWGGIGNSNNVTVSTNVSTIRSGSGCSALISGSTNPGSGIQGYQNQSALGSLPSSIQNCIGNANNYLPNTDVVVVRYADPDPADIVSDTNVVTTAYSSNIYVRSQPGYSGWLFQGSEVASAPTALSNTSGSDPVFNYPYIVQLFYVRPCAVQANGTSCQSTDDSGQPKPTLMQATISGAGMVQQPLVDGVEMFRCLYGLDTQGSKKSSQWMTAGSMVSANWPLVLAVRYSIVVRGDATNSASPDKNTYTLADGSTYTPTSVTFSLNSVPDQYFSRRIYSATVQVRNRVRY